MFPGQPPPQQQRDAFLGRINNAFGHLNAIQTLPAVLGNVGRPQPQDVGDPQDWIDALYAHCQRSAYVADPENLVRAKQFRWLRSILDTAHAIFASGGLLQESLDMMVFIEGHIAQWDNLSRRGIADPAASPTDLPFLWGLDSLGMLRFRDATAWMQPWRITVMATAVKITPPQYVYLQHGKDTLVMGLWALRALYRCQAVKEQQETHLQDYVRELCARFAFLLGVADARKHVPNLERPSPQIIMLTHWNNFHGFRDEYVTHLDGPDRNDELETVTMSGLLVVVRAGLVRESDCARLNLCLGKNPPRVMFPLPPVHLLQVYKGFFHLRDGTCAPDEKTRGSLRNLIERFEFLARIPVEQITGPGGNIYYKCSPNWLASPTKFYQPLIYGDKFIAENIEKLPTGVKNAVANRISPNVTTVAVWPLDALRDIPYFLDWSGVQMAPVLRMPCENMFHAIQKLHVQNRGRVLVAGEISREMSSEGMVRDGLIQDFSAYAVSLSGLCGPVCLCDIKNCALCLADGRIVNFGVLENSEQHQSELGFAVDLLFELKGVWDEYKANGLVYEDFPEVANKRYPNEKTMRFSAEMEALRRCISILIYQSKAPIISIYSNNSSIYSIALSQTLGHRLPGLYLPPDPEILARAVTKEISRMPSTRPYDTIEEARAFFAELLRDFPEVDTATIHMIAAGFFTNAEWTQTPQSIGGYLYGYFDGLF
jgi:hypothetical protein